MTKGKFKNTAEFLAALPDDELMITLHLMEIVSNSIPNYKQKLSFNVPFYFRNKHICFIWPASIIWGKKKTYEGVRLGFAKGYLMRDELNYLDKGTRKKVFWRDFKNVEEIDEGILKTYLYEALQIDDTFK